MPSIHTHHAKTLVGTYKTDAITLLSHWEFTQVVKLTLSRLCLKKKKQYLVVAPFGLI